MKLGEQLVKDLGWEKASNSLKIMACHCLELVLLAPNPNRANKFSKDWVRDNCYIEGTDFDSSFFQMMELASYWSNDYIAIVVKESGKEGMPEALSYEWLFDWIERKELG